MRSAQLALLLCALPAAALAVVTLPPIENPAEKASRSMTEYSVGEEMDDSAPPPEVKEEPKQEKPSGKTPDKNSEKTPDDDSSKSHWLPRLNAGIQVLDKTRSRSVTVKSQLGKEYSVGALTYTVKKCFSASEEYAPDNAALVEISEIQTDKSRKKLFYGWLFSSEPALTYIENSTYDVVLSGCSE